MNPHLYAGLGIRQQNLFRKSLINARGLTAETITNLVFNYFDKDAKMANHPIRTAEYIKPRHVAMFFIRNKTTMSTKAIGRYFNRDHSTVINATQTVQDLIDTDAKYRADIEQIGMLL